MIDGEVVAVTVKDVIVMIDEVGIAAAPMTDEGVTTERLKKNAPVII
ncbi:unnamed protein product [Cylicostephanus goldi]|uniref:Uncharacterized protein n=1 Tax=Cylicostephanus goldi TaxID=71465 RepID=A0A3P7P0I0_CYLGO|nr:unnamed protein product [Cylicostephanus goldi]